MLIWRFNNCLFLEHVMILMEWKMWSTKKAILYKKYLYVWKNLYYIRQTNDRRNISYGKG